MRALTTDELPIVYGGFSVEEWVTTSGAGGVIGSIYGAVTTGIRSTSVIGSLIGVSESSVFAGAVGVGAAYGTVIAGGAYVVYEIANDWEWTNALGAWLGGCIYGVLH